MSVVIQRQVAINTKKMTLTASSVVWALVALCRPAIKSII